MDPLHTPYYPFRSAQARTLYRAVYEKQAAEWPVPSETRMATTSFGETFVRTSGPSSGPPLVLLHGMRSTSLSWMYNIKGLAAGYHTYTVDTPFDYGMSVGTRAMYGGADYACWLDELLSALRLGGAINLIGMSVGGWIAAQYALHCAGRLRKVVLIAPAATVLPLSVQFLSRLLLTLLSPEFFDRPVTGWLLSDLARQGQRGGVALEHHRALRAAARRAFLPLPVTRVTVLTDGEWQSIDVPLLFLVGEHEKIYSPHRAIARLTALVPHAHTAIIAGAGHDLAVSRTEEVNRAVLNFLA